MKKLFMLGLVVLLSLSTAVPVFAETNASHAAVPNQFVDVPQNHWAVAWINQLYTEGVTGGCSTAPLRYCPDAVVTRAQMAVFLVRVIHGSTFTPPATSVIFKMSQPITGPAHGSIS